MIRLKAEIARFKNGLNATVRLADKPLYRLLDAYDEIEFIHASTEVHLCYAKIKRIIMTTIQDITNKELSVIHDWSCRTHEELRVRLCELYSKIVNMDTKVILIIFEVKK